MILQFEDIFGLTVKSVRPELCPGRRVDQLRADAKLLADERPFLAVCLGQQALCHELGIPLAYKDIVFQGTQSPVELDGGVENVGFYNTFVGRVRHDAPEGVTVETDPDTGDVHLVRGPHFRGIQFHAESILTEQGFLLLRDLLLDLLAPDGG